MLGKMAANTFALDSVVELTALMADAKTFDIRLEAAIAKMWNSEVSFKVFDDADSDTGRQRVRESRFVAGARRGSVSTGAGLPGLAHQPDFRGVQ